MRLQRKRIELLVPSCEVSILVTLNGLGRLSTSGLTFRIPQTILRFIHVFFRENMFLNFDIADGPGVALTFGLKPEIVDRTSANTIAGRSLITL